MMTFKTQLSPKSVIIRTIVLVSILLFTITVKSQTGISTINVSNVAASNSQFTQTAPSDASNDIQANSSYTIRNGRGNNLFVNSYIVSGTTYDNFLEPDTLAIRRTDGSRFINIWYTLITDPDGNFTLDLDPEEVTDADEIYKLRSVNAGYDNILVNEDNQASGSIQAQTERVDIIWYNGIVTCAPENAVFPVVERGGNDEVKVAAITSLDSNGEPDGYSDMVLIEDNDWPQTGQAFNNYLVFRRQSVGQDPLPLINIGTFVGQPGQTVQGVAVSFTELGIAANQIVYGYSIFASDVDDALHDLTDISTFPTNTLASNSGIDLVAGVTAAVSSDNCLTNAHGPGGYKTSLSTWLKANETDEVTTSTEGSAVSLWEDHWIAENDFSTGDASPTYRSTSSTINFNQTVDFSGNTSLTTDNNDEMNDASVYTKKGINLAFRTDASDISSRQTIFEQGGGTRGLNVYIFNSALYVSAWNRNNDGIGAPWNNGSLSTASGTIETDTEYIVTLELDGNSSGTGTLYAYLNGQLIGSINNVGLLYRHAGGVELGASDGSRFEDGTTNGNFYFEGELSELIYCNEPGAFSTTQRNRIESYLAIKYGITLNQSPSPYNYVNSNGQVIFNTTIDASLGGFLQYNNDIAGIGRDDASELEQQASRSENDNSVVTIDKGGSFSSNNSFLIWGNDNGSNTDTETSDVPPIINQRIERVWRVGETGETGAVSISFDLNELSIPGTPGESDYSLLVAGQSSGADFNGAQIISGGVLSGNTITFNNVNLESGEYFTLGTGFINCAPGGISSDLALWLKADLGPNNTTEDGEVLNWNDRAGSNNAQGTGGTAPTYQANNINFNPALDFNGSNEFLSSSTGFHSSGYFMVLTPDNSITAASTRQVPLGFDVASTGAATELGGFFFGNLFNGVDDVIGHISGNGTNGYAAVQINNSKTLAGGTPLLFHVKNNAAASNIEIYQNAGNNLVTTTDGNPLNFLSNEDYVLGRFYLPNGISASNFFNGKIAEVISYSTRPSDAESARIQSYLSIKYGITIDQSTAQDYLASDGGTIWDASTNAAYDADIAGIGRDDNSCLEQKQSKSINTGSIATIGLGGIYDSNFENPNSFTADDSFLVWGNDAASATEGNAINSGDGDDDLPTGVAQRMRRVWRVEETGTVGETSISFDLSGLGYGNRASDFKLIVDSDDGDMSNATVYNGGTFDGNVITFDNVNFADGDYFTLGTQNSITCGPGGVNANLALWLRADESTGSTTDDTDVNTWDDQSTAARDASVATGGGAVPVEPTYQSSSINFNPAIEFYNASSDNNSYLETSNGNNVSGSMTLISVFQTGQAGGSTSNFEAAPAIIGGGDNGSNQDYGIGMSNGRLHFNAGNNNTLGDQNANTNNARTPSGTVYNDFEPYIVTGTRVSSTANGSIQLYVNSANVASGRSTNTSLSGPNTFGIGNHDDYRQASQFSGLIAETIVFSGVLSTTQRQQVESYLAIKYGITRTSGSNYLASDGSTAIWDLSEAASGYNNDIAGIGRDDGSCLTQRTSKSENDDALVTMSIPSFNSDNSWVVWGNDNQQVEGTRAEGNTEYDPSQVSSRLWREWYVQETGTVGNVTLTFDLDEITGPAGEGSNNLNALRLMVDNDGDFTSGTTLISPSAINNVENTVTFTVNFTDQQYFTLGSEESAALPITLVSFDLNKLENGQIDLKWSTTSEQNNAFFFIERSQDGRNFKTIGSIEGAGNSQTLLEYSFLDTQPDLGFNYYRLKQVDFNGQFEYSEIKAAYVDKVEVTEAYSVYPNPVNQGDDFTIAYSTNQSKLVHISLVSANGIRISQLETEISPQQTQITLSSKGLNKGLNLIRIREETGKTTVLKLLVQ